MANNTIYPYGTGGTLPSNIAIINDLVTGGADKALSAEMGKVLNEALEDTQLIDFSTLIIRDGVVASDNKWYTGNGAKHVAIPVSQGVRYYLKLLSVQTGTGYYAFVTSSYNPPYSSGDSVPIVSGGSRIATTVGTPLQLTPPSDAAYLILAVVDGAGYECSWECGPFQFVNLKKLQSDFESLGRKCLLETEVNVTTRLSEVLSIGTPNTNGSVGYDNTTRAFYRFHTTAGKISITNLSSDWYVALHLCNRNWEIINNLGWQTNLNNLDLQDYTYIQLVFKYGSDGTTEITQSMINSVSGYVVEHFAQAGEYEPAAPFSVKEQIDGVSNIITSDSFVNGTIDTSGNVISNNTRIVTFQSISLSAGTVVKFTPNGQKFEFVFYSATGTYESVSGWLTEETEILLESDKKVRFLVAKTDNSSITPAQLAVRIEIITSLGIERRVARLESASGGALSVEGNDSFTRWNKTIIIFNPYKDRPSNIYKGQLHCHTTNSDGSDSPTTVVEKYIAAGYDFLTITDHNYITPNPGVTGIVWLCTGYEDTHNAAGYQHMNILNADAVFNRVDMYQTSNTPQMLVDHFVKDGHSVVSYNHPEYPAVYASDGTLENLPRGISFVEVFNATIQTLIGTIATPSDLPSEAYYGDMYDCTGDGKRYKNTSFTYNSPTWTQTTAEASPDGNLDRGFRIMLDTGKKVFCTAVDDYHRGDRALNRGWVMVFANERTKESIMNALLSGCSYASTGVILQAVDVKDGVVRLTITDGDNAVTTFYGQNNTVLATKTGSVVEYPMVGNEKYVRAMVVNGRMKAWTQPIWVLGVKDQYNF